MWGTSIFVGLLVLVGIVTVLAAWATTTTAGTIAQPGVPTQSNSVCANWSAATLACRASNSIGERMSALAVAGECQIDVIAAAGVPCGVPWRDNRPGSYREGYSVSAMGADAGNLASSSNTN